MGGGGGRGSGGGGGGGGVEDFLPIIEMIGDQDAQISEFKGRAVGVDVLVWLHKGLGLVEAARQALQKPRVPVAAALKDRQANAMPQERGSDPGVCSRRK